MSSLGTVLWFHTCDELDIKLDKLMLVAPVSMDRVIEEAKTFYPYPIAKDLKSKRNYYGCVYKWSIYDSWRGN